MIFIVCMDLEKLFEKLFWCNELTHSLLSLFPILKNIDQTGATYSNWTVCNESVLIIVQGNCTEFHIECNLPPYRSELLQNYNESFSAKIHQ